MLDLLFEREAREARHACAHCCLGGAFDIEQTYCHAVVLIHQRRIAGQLAPTARERDLRGQVPKVPQAYATAFDAYYAGISLGR